MKASELLEYKTKLEVAITNKEMAIFFNDSILHAMMIMAAIFQKASMEPQKCVRMYCGEFSLFRDKTEDKVYREKACCSLEDLDNEQRNQWDKLNFYRELQNAFKKFLALENSSLEIIIANNIETLPQNAVWNIIKQNERKIKIYKLKDDVGLDHFVTTTDSYRVENSDINKTAICSFRDKEYASVLIDNFKDLLNFSQQINIDLC